MPIAAEVLGADTEAGTTIVSKELDRRIAVNAARRGTVWLRWAPVFASALLVLIAIGVKRTEGLSTPRGRVYRALDARLATSNYVPAGARSAEGTSFDEAGLELATLQARAHHERTAENLHRLGAAYLAAGKRHEATACLREAVVLDPNNAVIESDLAAADIASERYADAAERCGRLLHRDPNLPSAAFNWALALERLAHRQSAIEAWTRYLELDPSSRWAEEARAHLEALNQPRLEWKDAQASLEATTDPAVIRGIAERFPQRGRSLALTTLLPRWVASRRAEDLIRLQVIAQARLRYDRFLHDTVEHASSHAPELSAAMSEWERAIAGGSEKSKDFQAIGRAYAEAARRFERANSPMKFIAEVMVASSEYYVGDYDAALARLDRVDALLAATGYHTAKTEAAWVRGLVYNRRGRWNESLLAYRAALAAAQSAGETEHVVALRMLMAGTFDRIGEPAEAEKFRADAFRRLYEIGAPDMRMYTAYAEATWTALRAGRPHLALAFIARQREIARRHDDPLLIAETFVKQALALRTIGEHQRAAGSIATAQLNVAQVLTPGLTARVAADAHYVAATLAEEPKTAIAELTNALRIWDEHQWSTHSAGARLLRGERYLETGDRKSAEADFRAGLAEIERERLDLAEPVFRVAFFERSDRLFERLIEVLIDDGRTEEALTIAERKRSRLLLDQLATRTAGRSTPLDASGIAAAVARDVAIVELTMLEGGVAIWVVRREGITFARSTAARPAIEKTVETYRAAIASSHPSRTREGRWLFDQLLAPVMPQLAGASAVVIVADGVLQSIPFSTLIMPDGRYLVEAMVTAVAPSASVFLHKQPARSAALSVLAVAEPAPQGFSALRHAVREAQEIAALYPRGRLFVGTELKPDEFLRRARDVSTVHFGGHAQLDLERPSRSALVFESISGAPGMVTSADVAKCTLPNHPVVILAACSTARGLIRRNEGVDALAVNFLAAGARSVMATMWDIDDASSLALFRSIHQNLRDGVSPSIALREAQLAMLRGTDRRSQKPRAWGGVVVFGEL